MIFTEKELKEAKVVSLKDRVLREYQTIWNKEAEIENFGKLKAKIEFENPQVAMNMRRLIDKLKEDIELGEGFIETLEEIIKRLKN